MNNACLVVVDVQNDFMPGGALAVPRGDEVVPVINRLAARFENVGARSVEDVQPFVQRQQGKWHAAAFVIAGHEQDRHA